jgi:glycosyltransferase involved in cell wall biosynthesis
MRIWLIAVGEPLPTDEGAVRLLRTGLLARLLVDRGHEVLWWSSTFDHSKKRHRADQDTTTQLEPSYRLALLHSVGYSRNLSPARILNHRGIAAKFAKQAPGEKEPDVILTSFPTIELSLEAVRYGKRRGIPVIVDVNDIWPDFFLDVLPSPLRPLGALALRQMVRQTRETLRDATGITAVSETYLRWGLEYAGRCREPGDGMFPLAYPRPSVPGEQVRAAGERLREQGVDPSKLICWFIGSFGKMYDLATPIQAARVLAARGEKGVQFVFSGDGERRAAWTRMAEGLPNVVFTGWVELPQIAYMMSVAGIGLAAYARVAPQSLSYKLFEYLSAGLPVLSGLEGETKTLLERHDCGASYRPEDAGSLLDCLERLLRDEEWRLRLGRNARAAYETHYAAEVVYPRMADYLTGIGSVAQAPASGVLEATVV